MENQEYLKVLKSQLRSMDSKSRQNIIGEIRSAIDDAPHQKLEDRFGSVYQLAAQYLEDMPQRASWWARLGGGVKWVLMGIGLLTVLLIALVVFIVRAFGDFIEDEDSFDYLNLSDPALSQMNWTEIEGDVSRVEFVQSKAIVYTGDYERVSFACKKGVEKMQDEFLTYVEASQTLKISQSYCYVRLPNEVVEIDAWQTSLVLTELSRDLGVNLSQAQLRLANTTLLKVVDETKYCETDEIESGFDEGAQIITVSGKWCAIVPYEFDGEIKS